MKSRIATAIVLLFLVVTLGCVKKQPKIEYENEENFIVETASDGRTIKIVRYTIEDEEKGTLNIPPRFNKRRVTEIGPTAMADRYFVNINIPDTVVRIMDFALSGNYLTAVDLPKGMIEIGNGVFMSNGITKIVIPNKVKKIGYRAFCDNPLELVTIGENVELGVLEGWDINHQHWKYTAFEGTGFDEFYEGNYKKAGTFVKINGTWMEK